MITKYAIPLLYIASYSLSLHLCPPSCDNDWRLMIGSRCCHVVKSYFALFVRSIWQAREDARGRKRFGVFASVFVGTFLEPGINLFLVTGIKFVLCPRVSPLPPLNTPLIFLFLSFFPFVFLPFFLYNSVIRYQSGIGFRRPRVPLKAWLDINTRERERETIRRE